ncbi:MAG: hypothetical protein IT378_19250 [Sandaracinaceae bacterium]|nr:hypothetical protein [Sandaracinaceae bacterium]
MRFVYTTRSAVTAAALETALGPGLVVAEEPWPGRTVTRLVLQFRFEVRIGERDGEIALMHRACASPAQRRDDRRRFEQALCSVLQEGTP